MEKTIKVTRIKRTEEETVITSVSQIWPNHQLIDLEPCDAAGPCHMIGKERPIIIAKNNNESFRICKKCAERLFGESEQKPTCAECKKVLVLVVDFIAGTKINFFYRNPAGQQICSVCNTKQILESTLGLKNTNSIPVFK